MSVVLSMLALGLAVLAIVLATIANRRWARRPAALEGPAEGGGAEGGGAGPVAQPQAQPAAERGSESRSGGVDPGRPAVRRHLVDLQDDLADLRAHVAVLAASLDDLRGQVAEVAGQVDALPRTPPIDPTALRHVALVRYDAFADVGGRLSYSVALVDDTRSGLVLTTLAGKADVRTYVRTISAGAPDGTLTAEEQQALEAAVGSQP